MADSTLKFYEYTDPNNVYSGGVISQPTKLIWRIFFTLKMIIFLPLNLENFSKTFLLFSNSPSNLSKFMNEVLNNKFQIFYIPVILFSK